MRTRAHQAGGAPSALARPKTSSDEGCLAGARRRRACGQLRAGSATCGTARPDAGGTTEGLGLVLLQGQRPAHLRVAHPCTGARLDRALPRAMCPETPAPALAKDLLVTQPGRCFSGHYQRPATSAALDPCSTATSLDPCNTLTGLDPCNTATALATLVPFVARDAPIVLSHPQRALAQGTLGWSGDTSGCAVGGHGTSKDTRGTNSGDDEQQLRNVARRLSAEVPLILEGGHGFGMYHPRVRLVDDCWLGLRTSGAHNLRVRDRREFPCRYDPVPLCRSAPAPLCHSALLRCYTAVPLSRLDAWPL